MRTKNVAILASTVLAVAGWAGCGGGPGSGPVATTDTGDDIRTAGGSEVTAEAHNHWRDAIAMFEEHEAAANAWTPEACQTTTATRVRWFNQYSQQCERELNQLDAANFPMAAELRGEAGYVQQQLAPPGAVSLEREQDEGLGSAEASEDSSIPIESESEATP